MVEIKPIDNYYNYLLTSYKQDNAKLLSGGFIEFYKDIFEKIINNNNNLDIQYSLKIIDSIQLNFRPNEEDLYIIAINVTILSMQMNINNNKREQLVKFLEKNFNHIIKHTVFLPYLYKPNLIGISIEFLQQGSFNDINIITQNAINDIKNKIYDIEYLSFFYNNIISYIHYNEFSVIILSEKLKIIETKIEFCKENIKLMIIYFFWRKDNPEKLLFNADIIIRNQLKFYSIYLLELVIESHKQQKNSKDFKINEILSVYFDIIFKLSFDTSHFVIAILCVLIIYIKILGISSAKNEMFINQIKMILCNKNMLNTNQMFIYDYLNEVKYNFDEFNQPNVDSIILLKLLDYNYFLKYNKSVEMKYGKRRYLNSSDFIMKGLFFFEKSYDFMNTTSKNFNNRSMWNLCESIKLVYESFPKIIKGNLLKHLKFIPNDDSLLYNLVQYYYTNKNKRNCKILIKKMLAKECNSAIPEISCHILVMLININLMNEKYGEALELAIINLDKSIVLLNDKDLQSRSYCLLGICYSKVGDNMTNYDERLHYYIEAVDSFKNAMKNDTSNNSLYAYFLSRQLLELRHIKESQISSDQIVMKNLNYKNENLFLTLKALVFICQNNYDEANDILDSFIKKNKYHYKYYTVIILMNYIMIFKALSAIKIYTEFENINNSMINSFNGVINEIDKEIEILEKINIQILIEKKIYDNTKKLMIYSKFADNYEEVYKDSNFQYPKGKIVNDKKILESIKIEVTWYSQKVLKSYFILYDIIYENNFKNCTSVLSVLNLKLANLHVQNQIDETNIQICNSLNFEFLNDFQKSAETYEKILETYPSNIFVLKRLSKIYLKLNDFGKAYIYINKAIKIDSKEPELWSLLSKYYLEYRDDAKYYECTMKEIYNSKLHLNCFLLNLLPKYIII